MQIINTLSWQIIDYASEFQSSQYNTHCFKSTQLGEQPSLIQESGIEEIKDIPYINGL